MSLPQIPKQLVSELVKGNCVLFVGAGLSQGAGLPGWAQLLRYILQWASDNCVPINNHTEIDELISQGQLLAAADELEEALGEWRIERILSEVFAEERHSPTETHEILPGLPFAAVITTNYDKLLEATYTLKQHVIPKVFTPKDRAALSTSLHGRGFYILKAHGDIDRTDTIVLTKKSYRQLIHDNEAYRQHLKTVFMTKTVLFLGFSLTDPDLTLLLDEIMEVSAGNLTENFALLDSRRASPTTQNRLVKDFHVRVIPYEPTTEYHPEVKDFLNQLLIEVQKSEGRTDSQSRPARSPDNPADPSARLLGLELISSAGLSDPSAKEQLQDMIATAERLVEAGEFDRATQPPRASHDFEVLRLHLLTKAWLSDNLPGSLLDSHEANAIFLRRAELRASFPELNLLLRTLVADPYGYVPGWYCLKDLPPELIESFLPLLSLIPTTQ